MAKAYNYTVTAFRGYKLLFIYRIEWFNFNLFIGFKPYSIRVTGRRSRPGPFFQITSCQVGLSLSANKMALF